jgi:hemolysin D
MSGATSAALLFLIPAYRYAHAGYLLQDWILVDGRHEKISAGMRISAEIKTGDRRVIEYLVSPVMQAAKEAGRER